MLLYNNLKERFTMLEPLKKLLKTEFEHDLFNEAINNLNSNSRIRFSSFAYVIRELIDIILKTRANDEDVKNCIWYEEPINTERKILRCQRIRYIVYGGFDKNIFDKIMSFDFENEINKINKYFRDELSSHVHLNENCLNYTSKEIEQKINNFEIIINNFLTMIDAVSNRIITFLADKIEEIVTDEFISQTFNDLDILSTHTRVEYIGNIKIEIKRIESEKVIGTIYGNVCVSLQYGSDRDIDDGIGDIWRDSYPFKIPFYIDIEPLNSIFNDVEKEDLNDSDILKREFLPIFKTTIEENLYLGINKIDINTSSFYE